MTPYFFKRLFRLNATGYTEVLPTFVEPWSELVCDGRSYVFQQNSSPSRRAVAIQDWRATNLHDHIPINIWSPKPSDLNPVDYYMWDVGEQTTKQNSHNTTDSLKAAITRAMSNIIKNNATRACQQFWSAFSPSLRLKTVTSNMHLI